MEQTLERIAQCNAVISVDTAVAHLSAGSDRPTTLLLGDPQTGAGVLYPRIPKPHFGIPQLKAIAIPQASASPLTASTEELPKFGDADAVLPKTVFTPAISMISGENNGGVPKATQ